MKLLYIILNDPNKLNPLLKRFGKHHINGGTLFDSEGMASSSIVQQAGGYHLQIYSMINEGRAFNKTIMMVINEEHLPTAIRIIEDTLGNLKGENTGIWFTVDVDQFNGILDHYEDNEYDDDPE